MPKENGPCRNEFRSPTIIKGRGGYVDFSLLSKLVREVPELSITLSIVPDRISCSMQGTCTAVVHDGEIIRGRCLQQVMGNHGCRPKILRFDCPTKRGAKTR